MVMHDAQGSPPPLLAREGDLLLPEEGISAEDAEEVGNMNDSISIIWMIYYQ